MGTEKVRKTVRIPYRKGDFRQWEQYQRAYLGTLFLEVLLQKIQEYSPVEKLAVCVLPQRNEVWHKKAFSRRPGIYLTIHSQRLYESLCGMLPQYVSEKNCPDRSEYQLPQKTCPDESNDLPMQEHTPDGHQTSKEVSSAPCRTDAGQWEFLEQYDDAGRCQIVWTSGDVLELTCVRQEPTPSGNYAFVSTVLPSGASGK